MQEQQTTTKHATVVGEQVQVDGRPIPGILCKSAESNYTLTTGGINYTVPTAQLQPFVNFLLAWQQHAGGGFSGR